MSKDLKCGTLRIPGVSYGNRKDETDHCFPKDGSHHYVCCTHIKYIGNLDNLSDKSVNKYNPLYGPITRNSDPSNYSWCTCSEKICLDQLGGKVEWNMRKS